MNEYLFNTAQFSNCGISYIALKSRLNDLPYFQYGKSKIWILFQHFATLHCLASKATLTHFIYTYTILSLSPLFSTLTFPLSLSLSRFTQNGESSPLVNAGLL